MMTPFPANVSDSDIIAFVDQWVALLEREDYAAAQAMTDHHSKQVFMTADNIREAIQRHGKRVTLEGISDWEGQHNKEVERWPVRYDGSCGEISYDLYVDGQHSDFSALFYLRPAESGLTLHLIDIGVR